MNELEETRALLKEACAMIQTITKHHAQEINDLHEMLRQSEARIDKTNQMIVELSHTITELNATNRDLRDSYIQQFDRTNSQVSHLVEENARLLKENESYYNSLKRERDHSREMMSTIVSQLTTGNTPQVYIDQK